MLLFTESIDNAEFIVEAKDGSKNYFIEGVFLQSSIKNRNGRLYPKEIMSKEVARYNKEFVQQNRAYGELGHPSGPTINLDRVSHRIVSLTPDGNNFIGKAKINDSPMGKIVKNLLDDGGKLGVSSRGLGSIKTTSEGVNEVQSDFYLSTAADIVADPSAPDAFVRGIMENTQLWSDIAKGSHDENIAEKLQESMKKMKMKQIEDIKLRLFEEFVQKISDNYVL